jgi:hypothetical protein
MVMNSTSINGMIDPSYEIEVVDDAQEAIRWARAQERVIVAPEGEPPVAVTPLIDLKLLLRLEDEEVDRIDAEDLRRLKESDEYDDRISCAEVKMQSRL